ncbi:hypothetical protein [Novosphingobium sp.]|uniref:hypothetical protein n=1 Tax=Novosphingobium sp. TaxID=1874826 RepID=UPI0038B6BCC4
MRVALLSSLEAVPGEPQGLRGDLPVGGRSVLRHQLALALAFGCKRIVALAETLTGELVGLQHVAEEGGARFHVVANTRAIVPLVAPEDELLVLADGLLAAPGEALRLLEAGPAIVTLPVETGIAAGFERIDINHAFAGAMRVPGRIVAGLGDLPSDWNPVSALLRLAVQAHLTMRDLPGPVFAEGRWALLRTEAEAHAMEPKWLSVHAAGAFVTTPTGWLAALAVRLAGSALLHAGTRPLVLHLAAVVLVLLGLGAGWFGWTAAGLLACGLGAVVSRTGDLLGRIERNALLTRAARLSPERLFGWALDGAIVSLCAWRSAVTVAVARVGAGAEGVVWLQRCFAPVALLLALRLLARVLPASGRMAWFGDRLLATVVLAILASSRAFDAGVGAMVVGLLAFALARPNLGQNGAAIDGQAPNGPLTSNV